MVELTTLPSLSKVKVCVKSTRVHCYSELPHRLSNYEQADVTVYRLADGEALPGLNDNMQQPSPLPEIPKPTDSDVIHIDDTDIESPTLSDAASPPARAPGSRKRPKKSSPVVTYGGQRKSKRIRTAAAAKKGTTFSIRVSKDDTIRDVKRKVRNQRNAFFLQLASYDNC
jgi:hypothetical protein